jgi:hypothetical protein
MPLNQAFRSSRREDGQKTDEEEKKANEEEEEEEGIFILRFHDLIDRGTRQFRVRGMTSLRSIFDTYAELRGKDSSYFRFMLDGERMDASLTPEDYDSAHGDTIHVMHRQGGPA